ncbi:hypothetical protein [Streptomyces orinoci]|uniref:Uncharacterized protein n=1 Tax=Streptomyces orinoci TaxID=67339 RepID=A0ABV3JYP8_STRON|nr:hypothetical protein [Streptomyces orinoci]
MGEEKTPDYERISITVPRELAEQLRGMKDANVIESVSAFVTRTLAGQIDRDRRHRESDERLRQDFGLDEDRMTLARQWADDATNQRTRLSLEQYIATRRSSAA